MLDLVTTTSWSAIDYLAAVPSRAEVFVLCGAAYAVLYRHDARLAVLNRRLTRFLSAMSGAIRDRARAEAVGATAGSPGLEAGGAVAEPEMPPLTRRFISEFVQALAPHVPAVSGIGPADAQARMPEPPARPAPGPHFAFGIMSEPRCAVPVEAARSPVVPKAQAEPGMPAHPARTAPCPEVSEPERGDAAATPRPAVPKPTVPKPAAVPPMTFPRRGPVAHRMQRTAAAASRAAEALPDVVPAPPSRPAEPDPAACAQLEAIFSTPLGLEAPAATSAGSEPYAEAYRLSLAARIEHEQRLQKLLTDRTESLARRTAAAEPAGARPRKAPAPGMPWSWSAALPLSLAGDPYETALGGV